MRTNSRYIFIASLLVSTAGVLWVTSAHRASVSPAAAPAPSPVAADTPVDDEDPEEAALLHPKVPCAFDGAGADALAVRVEVLGENDDKVRCDFIFSKASREVRRQSFPSRTVLSPPDLEKVELECNLQKGETYLTLWSSPAAFKVITFRWDAKQSALVFIKEDVMTDQIARDAMLEE